MTNLEKFIKLYTEALTKAVLKAPQEYSYSVDKVPEIVEKMLFTIQKGEIKISSTLKQVCKKLNISPNLYSIKQYLKENK